MNSDTSNITRLRKWHERESNTAYPFDTTPCRRCLDDDLESATLQFEIHLEKKNPRVLIFDRISVPSFKIRQKNVDGRTSSLHFIVIQPLSQDYENVKDRRKVKTDY